MGSTSLEDVKSKKFWAAVFAEFLGTALLVLVACGSTLFPDGTNVDVNAKVLRISLTFGLSVATIVWAICDVSGGHINPAVTIGFLVTRKISIVRFFMYVIFQSLGALVGAALLKAVTPSNLQGSLGTSAPDGSIGVNLGQIFGVELLITFVFVMTVLASCDGRRNLNGSAPLAIGLTITMCHLWAVPFSGSGMNPARVFGPAAVTSSWTNHWVYWVAPLIGGIFGAIVYDWVFAVNATAAKVAGMFKRDYDDGYFESSGRSNQISNADDLPLKENP